MNKVTEYKTRDLAEASAFITKGQEITRIEREGAICYFVFNNSELCKELSNKFFFGNFQVNARELYESMNRLKNRIFS
ncbi:MAG: hypothetical protein ABIJ85_03545 [bacterium]